ncbi:MAG: hypothetical protein JRH20_09810 [Deltaproteobacteria bacterium]|nr:hypothetical protein [Deltaproteobacteria bacterium]
MKGLTEHRTDNVHTPRDTPRSGRVSLRWLLLSSVVHLLLSLVLAMAAFDAWIPKKLDIVWLDLDNRLGVPRRPAPKKEVVAPAPALKKASVTKAKPAPKAKKRPKTAKPRKKRVVRKAKPRPSPAKVALEGLVPGDAALMLLVHTKNVRGTPYAHTVRRLLEVFYDHKMLLWGSGIDPINDLDALLIATANPYRVTSTFLAARFHKGPHWFKRGIERATRQGSHGTRWSPHPLGELGHIPSPPRLRHDPRKVLLREGLMMIVNPRDMSALARPRDKVTKPNVDKPTSTTLIDRLHDMGKEDGERHHTLGLELQAINLQRLVRMPPDLPSPLNAKVMIPTTSPAQIRALLHFASPALAERFLRSTRARLEAAQRSIMLRLLGVGSLLGRIHLKRRGSQVSARAKLSTGEVRDLLEMLRGAIPQIHIPGMAPRRPSTPLARPPKLKPPAAGQKAPQRLKKGKKLKPAPAPKKRHHDQPAATPATTH